MQEDEVIGAKDIINNDIVGIDYEQVEDYLAQSQYSETQYKSDQQHQQEDDSGITTSTSVGDKPEEGEINPTIRLNELKNSKYNLRQRARSHPINYRDQICLTNQDLDKQDDIQPVTTSEKSVPTTSLPEACDGSSSDESNKMVTKIKFFVCNFKGCGKVLRTRSALEDHRRRHYNPKGDDQQLFFRCEYNYCHKIFKTKRGVDRHQAKCHTMVTFKCHFQNCGKEFATTADLTKHFEVHSFVKKFVFDVKKVEQNLSSQVTKRFKCHICCACFSDRSHMMRHLNKVTDRFKCEALGCSYRGGQSYDLKRYVNQIHLKQ